jgi:hypothetical protein
MVSEAILTVRVLVTLPRDATDTDKLRIANLAYNHIAKVMTRAEHDMRSEYNDGDINVVIAV